jgi:hypothetical protein
MKTAVLGAIASSALFFATPARAQNLAETIQTSTFGNPGQVAISQDFSVTFHYNTENSAAEFRLAPAIDYFIAPQLSLGGQFVFRYFSNDPYSESEFGIGPRIGFNLPLAPMFSLWLKAGFLFTHTTASATMNSVTVSQSANFLTLGVAAPFLFHPVPHFFIGFGPNFFGNVAGGQAGDRFLVIALETVVGGYFDW